MPSNAINNAISDSLIQWLLDSDVSVQYQVQRDLFNRQDDNLQHRIEKEGWGAKFLSYRHLDGHWGRGFYQPKWISSHYTLLDLKNLNIASGNKLIQETLDLVFQSEKAMDGGISPLRKHQYSDVCINGMVLNYASYFKVNEKQLESVVDFLLSQQMRDGGFNCRSNSSGAIHSSLHTTLSVLEGILEYQINGYTYRLKELQKAGLDAEEFILMHRLFLSDRTGEIINKSFLKLYYPSRWYYDILRALDYFRAAATHHDKRMDDALQILIKKRKPNGQWLLAANHPGLMHFQMEKPGQASRWNTLRALRVLKYFNP